MFKKIFFLAPLIALSLLLLPSPPSTHAAQEDWWYTTYAQGAAVSGSSATPITTTTLASSPTASPSALPVSGTFETTLTLLLLGVICLYLGLTKLHSSSPKLPML